MEGAGQGYPPNDPNQPENPAYPPPTQPPQQGGYPPQQGGYPPPQGYPPQTQGYPPQPQGYPPPQEGYPPQPQGYPPPQGYYPDPQKDVPPPYQPQPPPVQQQTTTGVVVVTHQPAFYVPVIHPAGDHYRILSIINCIFCCFFGSPLTLFCTIPAMIFSFQAIDAEQRGDNISAASYDRTTIALNIVAFVFGFVIFILWVIGSAV